MRTPYKDHPNSCTPQYKKRDDFINVKIRYSSYFLIEIGSVYQSVPELTIFWKKISLSFFSDSYINSIPTLKVTFHLQPRKKFYCNY